MPARIPTVRVVASVALGLVTTLAVAWGLALWAPIERGHGTVAIDGDHLQPWLLRVERPGAARIIFFEKGRIYSKPNVGPPGGSSSAVGCWSFATSTRNNPKFVRGEVTIPEELKSEMARTPQTCWGIAEDSRGWPLHAFRCVFIGTMATDSLHVYTVRDGVRREPAPGARESLVEVRALPIRPVWKGILVNTLLGAIAWFLLLSFASWAVAAVFARFRRPAGHCPQCGYDLLGHLETGCPECGWNRPPQNTPSPSA